MRMRCLLRNCLLGLSASLDPVSVRAQGDPIRQAAGEHGQVAAEGALPVAGELAQQQQGFALVCEPDTWHEWWHWHGGYYLRVRQALPADARPGAAQVAEIVTALQSALIAAGEGDRDLAVACMLALAQIGQDPPGVRLVELLVPRLRSPVPEISAVAALSIGLAAASDTAAAGLLAGLVLDQDEGRAVTGSKPGLRMRCHAAYGLALLAQRSRSLAQKRAALQVFRQLVEEQREDLQELRVAAVVGLGLLQPELASQRHQEPRHKEQEHVELHREALALLAACHQRPVALVTTPATTPAAGKATCLASHASTAIARLLDRNHAMAASFRELFAEELRPVNAAVRGGYAAARSAALALGQLVRPWHGTNSSDSPDSVYCELLADTYQQHQDPQTRFFAILALGQIDGPEARRVLLQEHGRAVDQNSQAWCALALGLYCFHVGELQSSAARGAAGPDRAVGEALWRGFQRATEPGLQGALAIALGLGQHSEAAVRMRAMLSEPKLADELVGCLSTGLALLGDREAIDGIRHRLVRRLLGPEVLERAALALARLGDRGVVDQLASRLDSGDAHLGRTAAATYAMARIGDQRSSKPLLELLGDPGRSQLTRAFAAAALGSLADPQAVPWNWLFAKHANYRDMEPGLRNGRDGVLDLLW